MTHSCHHVCRLHQPFATRVMNIVNGTLTDKAIHYSDWRVQLVLTSNTDHVTWWTLEHVELRHTHVIMCADCVRRVRSAACGMLDACCWRFDRQDHPLQRMISTAWVLHIAHIHVRSRSSIYIQYAHHRHTVIPSRIQSQEQSQLLPFAKQETPNLVCQNCFYFHLVHRSISEKKVWLRNISLPFFACWDFVVRVVTVCPYLWL